MLVYITVAAGGGKEALPPILTFCSSVKFYCIYALQHKITIQLYGLDLLCPSSQ